MESSIFEYHKLISEGSYCILIQFMLFIFRGCDNNLKVFININLYENKKIYI